MPFARRAVGRGGPLVGAVAALVAWLVLAAPAAALDAPALRTALQRDSAKLGSASGAYVVDLDANTELYSSRPDTPLAPASNEKLFTTAAALLRFGPAATLSTTVRIRPDTVVEGDTVRGDLYLVGDGDPSLDDAALRKLAAQVAATGAHRVEGAVVGDESVFDRLRGSYDSRFKADGDIGGWLSGLTWSHGRASPGGPARVAAGRLQQLLSQRGIRFTRKARTGRLAAAGLAAAADDPLAAVQSPPMRRLIASTNQPSDNFYAETLLKGLGARFGAAGTTGAGLGVVRTALARLGVKPTMVDGSGLSRADRTTPRQIVTLLTAMNESVVTAPFMASLSLAGRLGTLAKRMRGTAAAGRCPAKTGTLRGVSALSGYCRTTGGRLIAFSLLENRVYPSGAKHIEDRMVAAIARYDG